MSNVFPEHRDDIGVKIFPHDALVKRGDPEYYHYMPANAMFGDKFDKKVDSSSGVSPRVNIRRNDFSQSPSSQQSSFVAASKPEQAIRPEQRQAIEEHLEHHERLEKLADFNVENDLSPSPMVEHEISFNNEQHETHQHVTESHQDHTESHQEHVYEMAHGQPEYMAPVPQEHILEVVREVESLREELERANHEQPLMHDVREDGYEVVGETHPILHDPELKIEDNHLQNLLKKEYGEELEKRSEEHQHVEQFEHKHEDEHSPEHHVEHHKVQFEDEPIREAISEYRHEHEHEIHHEPAEIQTLREVENEFFDQHARHDSIDLLTTEHPVQHGIEKFNVEDEPHKHVDHHSMEHHIEHHQAKNVAEIQHQHAHQDQHSMEHHVEHHQAKNVAEIQHQHAHQDQHSMEHHVGHHAQKHGAGEVLVQQHVTEEIDPKEHNREYNTVRQMVQSVHEQERKHKDGHSPEHHVQHHKAKQEQQQYQARETTMELRHERHEVKLNIEVKQQQPSSTVHRETSYSEPKVVEVKQHHETTYVNESVTNKPELSPSRRIDAQHPNIDAPIRLKTDAIIAQLKSVGVDSDGVKTLKDLKEEKKMATIRKEEEVKSEIEKMKREYTTEKFMTTSPTHGGKTGFELPEWKRKQIAQKKAEEAIKAEEARLWKEFDEWKNEQSPSWVMKQRKSQP